jgi:zinc protease
MLLRALAVSAFAAVLVAACNRTGADQSDGADGGLNVPPLEFTHRQLENGLDVYAMPDPNTASVSVQVWYDVGSKDDPPGRSGFAHLFEHLMFKSTANMPPEFFDRLTEDAGGFNNASTWNDFTNYYEVVPANHLQRVLWGEAERMGSLVVDAANFASERDVVKEELRQSVLSNPYGKLFYLYLNQTAFDIHPYGRPGIGSIADLDAATLEDVRAFHAAYYRPDNAVLVVSGNFDPKQLDAWVDQYFAGIKTPARPIPRVTVQEPERAEPRSFTVYEPNVPLPAVSLSWRAPDAKSKDVAAWQVMNAILSSGQSSRLYRSLVYDQQLAADVGTNFEITAQPGVYALYAILSDGKSADDGLAALRTEVAKLRDQLVTEAELEEARNELVTATLQGRETAEGRAEELARSVILFDDPGAADRLLAEIQAVTAADVQRVAQAILRDSASVAIRYLPETLQNGAPEDAIADAATIQANAINIPAAEIPTYTLAAEGARVQPPAAGAAVAAKLPTPSERTLENGLRVIVAQKPGVPLISASLRIAGGASTDPKDLAGLAAMTADIATRGTATRSATQISQEIESLGAGIEASAGPDATDVSVAGRADKADAIFAILADVVQNPAFAPEEIERARQETLDGLMVSLRQPSALGGMAMTRALYGDGPYGGVASPRSIQAISQDAMKQAHAERWRPDNAVLVMAGDIAPDAGFALAERTLGSWAKPETALPAAPAAAAAPAAPDARSIVVDVPQIGQAAVMMGLPAIARTDADYFPLLVANDVLGGGYSARLNAELRIRRGLTYGSRATLAARRSGGAVTAAAQTRNDAVPQVIDLMAGELARLGSQPIPAAEMEARKAVLIGGFGRTVETTAGLAGQLSALAQFGLPLGALNTYATDVGAVTAEQAGAAARRFYDPAKADLVVVGDAETFWTDVKRRRPNAERINVEALNLDTAALK